MPNREKVMRGLLTCGTPGMPCEECPYYEKQSECSDLLCMDALDLLKAQEPRVMTRAEVEAANGKEFYSESRDDKYLCLDHVEGNMYFEGNMYPSYVRNLNWKEYNKTWRCWTEKPTDEQRRETAWEWEEAGRRDD